MLRPIRAACCRWSINSAPTTCCCTPATTRTSTWPTRKRDSLNTCPLRWPRKYAPTTRGSGTDYDASAAPPSRSETLCRRSMRLRPGGTLMVVTAFRSETDTENQTEVFRRTRRALIDCDFHNELDSIKDLYPYLSARWREHLETYGTRSPGGAYYPRFMD